MLRAERIACCIIPISLELLVPFMFFPDPKTSTAVAVQPAIHDPFTRQKKISRFLSLCLSIYFQELFSTFPAVSPAYSLSSFWTVYPKVSSKRTFDKIPLPASEVKLFLSSCLESPLFHGKSTFYLRRRYDERSRDYQSCCCYLLRHFLEDFQSK